MNTYFLGKGYVAISLIESKKHIFNEGYITISELNQFGYFLQKEFNKRNLDIIVTSETLSYSDFKVIGEVIIPSNSCSYNLDFLPIEVLKVLYDFDFIRSFWWKLRNNKSEIKKELVSKMYK